MFSPDLWNKSGAVSAYDIDNSCRFNIADSAYLSRTPGSAGNRKTWTWSAWSKVDTVGEQLLFYAHTDSTNYSILEWAGGTQNQFTFTDVVANNYTTNIRIAAYGRDPAAWYHLVLKYDSTPASPDASDIALYINGVQQTAFHETPVYPSQNQDSSFSNNIIHYIGTQEGTGNFYGGYLAEMYFIDGQALDADSFGELDATTNQWIPKDASGLTFGTNGFYQKYGSSGGHTSFPADGTYTVPAGVTSVDYLVVAGGAGGGGDKAGGGGAGGFRTGTLAVTPGNVYDVTVGDGGAGNTGSGSGSDGGDSIFSSITSTGGGGGGGGAAGRSGGSGGGGGQGQSGGSAAAGQGYAGGSGMASYAAGGGGGAGVVGGDGNSAGSGSNSGGNGLASSITGASVFYAGGGAGGYDAWGGSGGSGGGGGGGYNGNGADATGYGSGGAGGGGAGGNGGAGFPGIVIIKPAAGFGLGLDSSGEGNNFTATNLVATDQMIDTPTNNFCTWNAINATDDAQFVLLEGNLETQASDTVNWTQDGTFYANSGKWYFEIYVEAIGDGNTLLGLVGENFDRDTYPYDSEPTYGYADSGNYREGDSVNVSYGLSYTTGDIIGVALDCGNGTVQFYKNNAGQGSKSGTNLTGRSVSPMIGGSHNGAAFIAVANFGSDSSFAGNKTAQGNQDGNDVGDFYYTPPTDYLALCTDNLSAPAIALPGENFNTVAYQGNGTAISITGVGFQPDLVWVKNRTGTYGTRDHKLFNVISGANNYLESNTTDAEASFGTGVSFDSDGFTLNGDYGINPPSGTTTVSWSWKAGGSVSAGNNTDGSIDSTVSANTTAGFSIVKFEGSDSLQTVGHGLSEAPELILGVKGLGGTSNWPVYHKDLNGGIAPEDYYVYLNLSSAESASAAFWNDTPPDADVFTINTGFEAADTPFIAYCFHSVEGYSKVGSYTGNGDADGPFLYTGFKPAFSIIKSYSPGADEWNIEDNVRDTYNPVSKYLVADGTAAEIDNPKANLDFVSNGIKVRTDDNGWNLDGYGFLYIAFAESPFKYSNAR